MSAVSFFEKFLGHQQQRAESAIAGYRELVPAIATGKEPNPAEVEHLLTEAGKSLDDLRKDVEHYQRRMALKAAVATMPKLEDERRTLDEQIAAADRILKAAEEQHEETDRKARVEHHNAEHQLSLPDTQRGHDRAKRYQQEAESLRREAKKAEKAKADFEKRRDGIEQRMRNSAVRSPPTEFGQLDIESARPPADRTRMCVRVSLFGNLVQLS